MLETIIYVQPSLLVHWQIRLFVLIGNVQVVFWIAIHLLSVQMQIYHLNALQMCVLPIDKAVLKALFVLQENISAKILFVELPADQFHDYEEG